MAKRTIQTLDNKVIIKRKGTIAHGYFADGCDYDYLKHDGKGDDEDFELVDAAKKAGYGWGDRVIKYQIVFERKKYKKGSGKT